MEQKSNDLYDMKCFKKSTEYLSKDICCQHLEGSRLESAPILGRSSHPETVETESDGEEWEVFDPSLDCCDCGR